MTMKNVEDALTAAKDRAIHLNKLKKKKIVKFKLFFLINLTLI